MWQSKSKVTNKYSKNVTVVILSYQGVCSYAMMAFLFFHYFIKFTLLIYVFIQIWHYHILLYKYWLQYYFFTALIHSKCSTSIVANNRVDQATFRSRMPLSHWGDFVVPLKLIGKFQKSSRSCGNVVQVKWLWQEQYYGGPVKFFAGQQWKSAGPLVVMYFFTGPV